MIGSECQVGPICSRRRQKKINYNIDSWSSHTLNFLPENIKEDKPGDVNSRWSSGSRDQDQYIILKLESPAILQTITFGKYQLPHVCNLKEFKLFVGLDNHHFVEVLHSGLRNDIEAETFPTIYKSHGRLIPCNYVKIVPLVAWGASFNYGIWFIELRGVIEYEAVQHALVQYNHYKEKEALRLIIKYLCHEQRFSKIGEQLIHVSGVLLQDSLLHELYENLITKKDLSIVESLLLRAEKKGYFNERIKRIPARATWKKLEHQISPSPRGGHQIVMDDKNGKMYLFGGWNGSYDLGDFWKYDLLLKEWTLISENTVMNQGPSPRSVHKMALHSRLGRIYTLGRYIDPAFPPPSTTSTKDIEVTTTEADFYCFEIEPNRWTCLSLDTKVEGGPDLIYDHQMCLDEERDTIYIFGGKSIRSTLSEPVFSGLYSYQITTNQWKLIRSDAFQPPNSPKMKSRVGHSMLWNAKRREMYVFCGQRYRDLLSDFYVYNVDEDTVTDLVLDMSYPWPGPSPSFTQRAVMNEEDEEIVVLFGDPSSTDMPNLYPEDCCTHTDPCTTAAEYSSTNLGSLTDVNRGSLQQANQIWVLSLNEEINEEAWNEDKVISSEHDSLSNAMCRTKNHKFGFVIPKPYIQWKHIKKALPFYTTCSSNDKQERGTVTMLSMAEPRVRFAHQFTFDKIRKIYHLFGGTIGKIFGPKNTNEMETCEDEDTTQIRLNDHWELHMLHPSSVDMLKKALFLVRRQKYFEMIIDPDIKSTQCLKYLQVDVHEMVDLNEPLEAEEFKLLPQVLFQKSEAFSHGEASRDNMINNQRNALFEALVDFFPKSMRQPDKNVTDFIF